MKMISKLNQNAILTGCIDSYCLVCENLLKGEESWSHIEKPIHQKNLGSAPYVEKYRDEHVRKVKRGYYCEFCNTLIVTTPKVDLHIAEDTHNNKKAAQLFKRLGNSVVISTDIFINETAWNGLIEDTCALCNVEFFDENIHKTEPMHILNLIQKKVVIRNEMDVYRMVDSDSFQCLTCNMIFAINTIEAHFRQDRHKSLLQKCKEFQLSPLKATENNNIEKKPALIIKKNVTEKEKDMPKSNEPINQSNNKITNDSKTKVNESIKIENKEIKSEESKDPKNTKSEQNKERTDKQDKKPEETSGKDKNVPAYESKTNVNMMVKVEEAFRQIMKPNFEENQKNKDNPTKEEEEAVNVTLQVSAFDENQALVKYTPIVPTVTTKKEPEAPKMDINDPVEFAKEHKLTFNKGNSNAFCRICNARLPSSLRSMKEHVSGNAHKSRASRVNHQKANIPRRPMHLFVKQRSTVMNMCVDDVILNDRLCLTRLSYLMITEQLDGRLRCQACEENLTDDEVGRHLDSASHEAAMEDTPVAWNVDGEFFREVRPGLFHCGYCNLIVGAWSNVSIHLECEEHIMNRLCAEDRLREHLPGILEHRQQRERAFLGFMMGHCFL